MAPTPRDAFGPDTTTDEVLEGIDLAGKRALITGGSSGLGAETARALASKGAQVVLTARDLAKAEGVAEGIRASTGNEAIEVEALELDSLESIRAFAHRFLAKHATLDLLVNNAGVMACPYATTRDGFELQLGTNHFGHFLMTALIAPALLAAAPARVVNLSSRGHQQGRVDFEDLGFETRPYDKWEAYGQSKTANVLFTVELERRFGDRGVHAYAVHPGVIPTELSRHMEQADFERVRKRASGGGGGPMKLKTVESGAATSVFAATAPELEGRGGLYLEDCHVAEVNDDADALEGVRSYALDATDAKRLWSVSEQLVGQTFEP